MSQLAPCPQCNRHVKVDESVCPFCGAGLDLRASDLPVPAERLGRSALAAFYERPRRAVGVLLAASAASYCTVEGTAVPVYGGSPFPFDATASAQSDAASDAGSSDAGSSAPDASSSASDAGSSASDAGSSDASSSSPDADSSAPDADSSSPDETPEQ